MKIRMALVALVSVVVMTSAAQAQPGTVFVQGGGGVLIPVGDFKHEQNVGGAYSVAAGYEFTDFLDGMLEFTHSFNDNDNERVHSHGLTIVSDEVKQNFIVGIGPRINFTPSDFNVRPYMIVQGCWYHFANFNSVTIDHDTVISDEDDDAAGIRAGLGIEGTIFQLYERRSDKIPLLELTLGAHGDYHHAFRAGDDRQFVTAMGTLAVRF
jgi:hypothetical protein